eukprot:m.146578 g.146578  ORF g.146578 m.146578 type:complete len:405 (-) comp30485_c0_seq1:186-1400(-)
MVFASSGGWTVVTSRHVHDCEGDISRAGKSLNLSQYGGGEGECAASKRRKITTLAEPNTVNTSTLLDSEAIVAKTKARVRAELEPEDWHRRDYVSKPELWQLGKTPGYDATLLPRINYANVSETEFIERFERPGVPVMIEGAFDGYPALEKWTIPQLLADYGDQPFKVGEDGDGKEVTIALKHYLHYAQDQRDDSPLYAFDGAFGDRKSESKLTDDYKVPKYFRDDLFSLLGSERPPYKWFAIGPARSGTDIHIDPNGTSAWNTLVQGHKRWVIFPPSVATTALKSKLSSTDAFEGINWFREVYPKTRRANWRFDAPIEFIQNPGETIFIPGGWHHVVVNMDLTIAVTQNFCSKTNFNTVWPSLARGRPDLKPKFYTELKLHHPDLAKVADSIHVHKLPARDKY